MTNDDANEPSESELPLRLYDHLRIKAYGTHSSKGGYKTRAPFPDDEILRNLAVRIRQRRLELNWDEVALARQAGVNAPSVNRIETGSVMNMDLTTMLRIVKALGLRIELIID